MLKTLLPVLVLGLSALPVNAADIQGVYLIDVRGSQYQVTEVHAIKRDIVPKTVALKNAVTGHWKSVRGEKYWQYQTIGGLPVRLNKTEYVANKDVLATVPDNRPLDVQHPNVMLLGRGVMYGLQAALFAVKR